MRKFFCDRCGKEIAFEDLIIPYYGACDLCPECYEKFDIEVKKLLESFKNRGDDNA